MPSKEYLAFQNSQVRSGPPDGMEPNPYGVPAYPKDYRAPVPAIPDGFSGGEVTVGGVRGLHLTRPDTRPDCAFLHIHGGGFTIGSAMDAMPLLTHFLQTTGLESYSVDYRLAPQHPFPCGVEDCVSFYQGLLALGFTRIVVGGESAGAGLTLALALALKERGLPMPAALWCSSPMDGCDFHKRPMYHPDFLSDMGDQVRDAYAQGADPTNPLLSALYGDFHGFPPLFLQASGRESLSAGCVRLLEKAVAADVEVRFHFGQEMPHTFAMDFGKYPEATNAMREITNFVNETLDMEMA